MGMYPTENAPEDASERTMANPSAHPVSHRNIVTGLPSDLVDELVSHIRAWQHARPLDRVLIITPDNQTAKTLNEELPIAVSRIDRIESTGGVSGLFGVEITSFTSWASTLIRDDLARSGRSPLPRNAALAITADAVRTTKHRTERLRGTRPDATHTDPRDRSTFHTAVLQSLIDGKKAGLTPDDIAKDARHRYSREIAVLYDQSERILQARNYLDLSDIIREATRKLDCVSLDDVAGVALFGPIELNTLDRRFVSAISRACQRSDTPIAAFIPHVPDAPAFAVAAETVADLSAEWNVAPQAAVNTPSSRSGLVSELFRTDRDTVYTDANVTFVSAADPVREWQSIARRIWSFFDERTANDSRDKALRFSDIHIAVPNIESVRSIARDVFVSAGIPVRWDSGTQLSQTALGQSLIHFIDMLDTGLTRAMVVELLSTCPGIASMCDGEDIPTSEWDRIARQAGVGSALGVDGGVRATWLDPLERFANRLHKRLDADVPDYDEDDGRSDPARIENDIAIATKLCAIVEELDRCQGRIATAENGGSWEGWATTLRSEWESIAHPVERNTEVSKRIATVFDELAGYDALVPLASPDILRHLLRKALESARVPSSSENGAVPSASASQAPMTPRLDDSSNGVRVSDLSSARFRRPRVLFIAGLVDGAYPTPAHRSALTVIPVRAVPWRSSDGYQTEMDRSIAAAWLDYASAIAAPRDQVILSYSRAQPSGEERQIPSSLYFDTIRRTKSLLENGAWDERALEATLRAESGCYVERVVIPRIDSAQPFLNTNELELAYAAHLRGTAIGERWLDAPGSALLRERESGCLGPFDGILDTHVATASTTFGDPSRPVSPSKIETYATCPFRYFVNYALGIEPLPEPAPEAELDARDRGSIIHRLLARFFRHLHDNDIDLQKLSIDACRVQFDAIADDEKHRAAFLYGSASSALWDIRWEGIRRLAWRGVLAAYDESAEWVPAHMELSLGMSSRVGHFDNSANNETIRINLDGTDIELTIALHGIIDRVDYGRDGKAARIIDYKSGKKPSEINGFLNGGRSIQLNIYALGLADYFQRHGIDREVVEVAYNYLRESLPDDGNLRNKMTALVVRDRETLDAQESELLTVLRVVLDGIRAGVFPPLPHDSPIDRYGTCGFCDVKAACGSMIALTQRWRAYQSADAVAGLNTLRGKADGADVENGADDE